MSRISEVEKTRRNSCITRVEVWQFSAISTNIVHSLRAYTKMFQGRALRTIQALSGTAALLSRYRSRYTFTVNGHLVLRTVWFHASERRELNRKTILFLQYMICLSQLLKRYSGNISNSYSFEMPSNVLYRSELWTILHQNDAYQKAWDSIWIVHDRDSYTVCTEIFTRYVLFQSKWGGKYSIKSEKLFKKMLKKEGETLCSFIRKFLMKHLANDFVSSLLCLFSIRVTDLTYPHKAPCISSFFFFVVYKLDFFL